ncbi:MAG TPA: SCPU domain-containing protein [Erwinia persicina]|uniref:SCPU domain-containing protein n=1 Tax=Erwinia persicina TaxID=55211 RepID=A0A354ANQ2_9GAMM|nr:spore coat protein U domain-containing protein [Erwinia persicina]AXU97620.1 SCPU domain-containing protein [Erwinia persicina]MBC3945115.1 spore coat protein U domain-containing protein [Erwinia persicina]MBD8107150.1 spore coat protein U domain-containing protein [Erwinia persicina]MBD8162790.1 spore coat protein U domain-containing protein [Erwinia persicina]MBD8167724.1 spore coat protein U domain-containing protein [Erwinia persicina]
MKMKLLLLGCGLSLGVASSGYAATTTGSIAAKLILTAGCLVNGQLATNSTGVNFGNLDFGTSPATFDTLSATLVGSLGNGIFVRCSTGSTYSVQITSSSAKPTTVYGAETTQPRYLINATTATVGIAYTLYGSTNYTTPIANNTNLVSAGTPDPANGDNYPIYGRITGGGNNNVAIPAATYQDTINVAVNY